jgi:hypothetical protein
MVPAYGRHIRSRAGRGTLFLYFDAPLLMQ